MDINEAKTLTKNLFGTTHIIPESFSVRNNNGGIGTFIETLYGLKENNRKGSDFSGWELKSKESKSTTLTLCSSGNFDKVKNVIWVIYVKTNINEIKIMGYEILEDCDLEKLKKSSYIEERKSNPKHDHGTVNRISSFNKLRKCYSKIERK